MTNHAAPFRQNIVLLAGIIALAPFAIDAYLPAIPFLARDFEIEPSTAEFTISIFLVFFAIGQLFGGPIADRRGRRVVVLVGLVGFVFASVCVPLSQHFLFLIAIRAIQAFCGGFAIVGCMATTRDAYSGAELAKILSIITSIMLMAPIVAPFVGVLVLSISHWKWIFWILALYGSILFVLSWRYFDETLNPDTLPGGVRSSYINVLGDKKSVLLLLSSACTMSVMFVFLTSSSSIYQVIFGVSPHGYAIYFATNVVAVLLLTNINMYVIKRFAMEKVMFFGLLAQCIASMLLLSFSQVMHIWLFAFLTMVTVGSIGLVLANATSLLMTLHPRDAGTANALGGLLRFFMGGVVGAIPPLLQTASIAVMAIVMLVTAIVGLFSIIAYSSTA